MTQSSFPDYYEVLQISPNAQPETIQRVYRLLAQHYHPDNKDTGDIELFNEILEAYRVLNDPSERAGYDVEYRTYNGLKWKIFDRKCSTKRSNAFSSPAKSACARTGSEGVSTPRL